MPEDTLKPKHEVPSDDLTHVARKFLREHPEAKQALDLFGIADEQYALYLAAQQPVRYYTSGSTTEGGSHGELD